MSTEARLTLQLRYGLTNDGKETGTKPGALELPVTGGLDFLFPLVEEGLSTIPSRPTSKYREKVRPASVV